MSSDEKFDPTVRRWKPYLPDQVSEALVERVMDGGMWGGVRVEYEQGDEVHPVVTCRPYDPTEFVHVEIVKRLR